MNFYRDIAIPKKIKLDIVFESDNVIAFHHTKPSYKKHIVVIPKGKIDSILDINSENEHILLEILNVCKRISEELLKETGKGRIITNFGEYQETKHLHFHVISD